MRVLILGAGGHAQVMADILLRMQEAGKSVQVIGYLDDNPVLHGRSFLGVPVLGPVAELPMLPHEGVIVAIGDNEQRRNLFMSLKHQGESLLVAQHPSAVIAPDVTIGSGTMICAGVVINPGSVIGANIILNTGCTVDHHNWIGDHAHLAPGINTGGNVTIGEGALIGIGATVMPGCVVGAWSTIGAGSLVIKDVPTCSLVIGVPGRVVPSSSST